MADQILNITRELLFCGTFAIIAWSAALMSMAVHPHRGVTDDGGREAGHTAESPEV